MKIEAEYIENKALHSLYVTLSLGNTRDVVLSPRDGFKKNIKDREFIPPEGISPSYSIRGSSLYIEYPAGTASDNRIFFNLKGHGVGNIEDHDLIVQSDFFWIEKDGGHWELVEGTPLDFREETPIEERIRMGYKELSERKGYDHLYLISQKEQGAKKQDGEETMLHAATLFDHAHTLQMDVYTTYPTIYVYTANGFSGYQIGKGGCYYPRRGGILLEPRELPDKESYTGGRVEYRFYPIPQEFIKGVRGR